MSKFKNFLHLNKASVAYLTFSRNKSLNMSQMNKLASCSWGPPREPTHGAMESGPGASARQREGSASRPAAHVGGTPGVSSGPGSSGRSIMPRWPFVASLELLARSLTHTTPTQPPSWLSVSINGHSSTSPPGE